MDLAPKERNGTIGPLDMFFFPHQTHGPLPKKKSGNLL